MPNTNEAELARVFQTPTNQTTSEETLSSNTAFDVVVEAEAGNNVFGAGGAFKLQMVLTDLTASYTGVSTQTLSGNFGDGNWPAAKLTHRFVVPAQGAARNDHAYQAFAVLQAGNINPIVDFEQGDIFVITPP